MKAFSSSAINKSGKKFAPKAPVRRAPAPAPPPRRPSAAQQTPAPQPFAQLRQPAVAETVAATLTETSAPTDPFVTSTPTEASVTESSAQKSSDTNTSKDATAIPIPAPQRNPSISTPIPRLTAKPTAPPQTTPPATTVPAPVPVPTPSSTDRPEINVNANTSQEPPRNETMVSPARRRLSTSANEIRPSKRLKTAAEPPAQVAEAQPTVAQPPTPPATQPAEAEDAVDFQEEPEIRAAPASKGRKPAQPRKKQSQNGNAENSGTERRKRPRTRQKREPTPEGAENIEIAPTTVKMSDLCKDTRTGKMSKREVELRNMELAEQERKNKINQGGEDTETTPVKPSANADAAPSATGQDESSSADKPQAGPVMRIVNGEIVLDTASLQVDRHANAARDMGELEDVVENSLTRKINQASYGKRSKTESWDEEMTDLFYRGLRMFGTDFMMISRMFPGRNRRQIKLKFNNEERKHPDRIKDTLLGPSESIDIATYSEMTNTVYDDPRAIQQQLDEEKKQMEEQHAKDKAAQEELLRNPDGGDGGQAGLSNADKSNGNIKGKARNNKKQPAKGVGGGTEEVVGSIDDFP